MTRRLSLLAAGLALVAVLAAASAPAQPGAGSSDTDALIQSVFGDPKAKTEVHAIYPELLTRGAIPIPPSEKGDPMVIPFIRDEAVRQDALARMNEAVETGRRSEALALARHLVTVFPTSEEAAKAQVVIETLSSGQGGPTRTEVTAATDTITLPTFISTNTKMILTSPTGNQVMVGYNILREGDPVPDHPNVVVEEIRSGEVVYKVSNEFMSKTFVVSVHGN